MTINYKNLIFKIVCVIILCYYFDDIIQIEDFDSHNILLDKNHAEIFRFMKFHTKHQLMQAYCKLG